MGKMIHEELSGAIIGIAMEVLNEDGEGKVNWTADYADDSDGKDYP